MRVIPGIAGLLLVVAGVGHVPAAFAGSVEFVMTETHVEVGETVEFTITNHRGETIWLNGDPYWRCQDVPSGQYGAPCTGLPTLYPLGAGQSETITWDQIDCITELPVPPGLYQVEATWSSDSQPMFQITGTFFCIGDDPACDVVTLVGESVEDSTWGRVMALYR